MGGFAAKSSARYCVRLFVSALVLTMLEASYGAESETLRIAVARFSHETCTFCPGTTTVEDWERLGPPTRELFKFKGSYIGGFKRMCDEFGGVELAGILSPRGVAGGSSKSWNTRRAFDKYAGLIVNDIIEQGPFDGVFLSLHGAMAVTGVPKPEAELVRRVRRAVEDIPIVVTLDLHANEDHELSDAADAVFIVKRYPHYDAALQGERAARVLIKVLRGGYRPTMATRKPGVITPSVFQGTGVSPVRDIMERARRWECRHYDVYVSVAFGFAYADVPDVGATVMVVTNNDQPLADKIADDMAEYIWRVRKEFAGRQLPKTAEGVRMALSAVQAGRTPVVIADHSDRTGGSTHILKALIDQGAGNFCIATLRDEKAIETILANCEVGDDVALDLGGYSDRFAGEPVHVEGEISFLGEYSGTPTAVISFGKNNYVILTQRLMQVTSTQIFGPVGVDFDSLEVVVLKSRVHFRRGFHETGIAGAIIEVDAPGWGSADLTTLPYQNIPKTIYPIHGDRSAR